MAKRQWIAGVLAATAAGALSFAVGCEKPVREARVPAAETPTAEVAATTQPSDASPAAAVIDSETKPADTQPVPATMSINGLVVQFPATKLRVREPDGDRVLVCELFSDLPKSALREYDGNELYFEMTPTAPDGSPAKSIDGGLLWHFKAANSDKTDSPTGIFLAGQTTHLQPFDVWVKIERQGGAAGQLSADIVGRFRAFEDGTPAVRAPFVDASGRLPVELVEKR